MNTRDETKSSILFEALDTVLGKNINKARLKLIALFIIALNQVRTVRFENLAIAFDHSAKKDSSLRRIRYFMVNIDFYIRIYCQFHVCFIIPLKVVFIN